MRQKDGLLKAAGSNGYSSVNAEGRKKVIRMTEKRTLKNPARYSYSDCLRDIAPAPTGVNGTTLYQLLMVGGTVAFVVTANGVRNSGADFIEHSR